MFLLILGLCLLIIHNDTWTSEVPYLQLQKNMVQGVQNNESYLQGIATIEEEGLDIKQQEIAINKLYLIEFLQLSPVARKLSELTATRLKDAISLPDQISYMQHGLEQCFPPQANDHKRYISFRFFWRNLATDIKEQRKLFVADLDNETAHELVHALILWQVPQIENAITTFLRAKDKLILPHVVKQVATYTDFLPGDYDLNDERSRNYYCLERLFCLSMNGPYSTSKLKNQKYAFTEDAWFNTCVAKQVTMYYSNDKYKTEERKLYADALVLVLSKSDKWKEKDQKDQRQANTDQWILKHSEYKKGDDRQAFDFHQKSYLLHRFLLENLNTTLEDRKQEVEDNEIVATAVANNQNNSNSQNAHTNPDLDTTNKNEQENQHTLPDSSTSIPENHLQSVADKFNLSLDELKEAVYKLDILEDFNQSDEEKAHNLQKFVNTMSANPIAFQKLMKVLLDNPYLSADEFPSEHSLESTKNKSSSSIFSNEFVKVVFIWAIVIIEWLFLGYCSNWNLRSIYWPSS